MPILLTLASGQHAYALDFPPTDFDILSAENAELIGHGHYNLEQTGSSMTLHGENRYVNGEYDIEEEKLAGGNDSPITLLTFRHDFFDAAGAPVITGRVDTQTGLGVCGKADGEGGLDLKTEQFSFPDDTFAGSSVLIPIQNFVRRANRGEVLKLHVFNCAPSPKLIAVNVKPEARPQTWADYPGGELERIDIKANFGFWTLVIEPFIPKLAAWFDPSQNMLLVGAQLQRYYRGQKIILVRKREAAISNPNAGTSPPATIERPSQHP